jgi:hypothetical protein
MPAFQHSQCPGERMPTPSHPSTASRSRTAATNWATAAFTVPITAIASPSANRHVASCGDGPDGTDGTGAGRSTTDMPPTIKKGYDTLRRGPMGTTAPGAASPSQ